MIFKCRINKKFHLNNISHSQLNESIFKNYDFLFIIKQAKKYYSLFRYIYLNGINHRYQIRMIRKNNINLN
jgi:hypothetical protein